MFITQLMPVIDYIGSLIFMLGAFLAFFLSVVTYIIKVGDIRANRWISLFCLLTSIYLMRGYLMISGCYTTVPLITMLIDNARYAIGPFLLFYVKTVIDPQFRLKIKDILHILPLMINIGLIAHVYVMYPVDLNEYLSNWFTSSLLDPRYLADFVSRVIFFFAFCGYIIFSVHLSRNSNLTSSRQSFGKNIHLVWLRRFTTAFIPILVILVFCMILIAIGFPKKYLYFSVYFAVSLLTFVCGIFALMRPEIFYRAKPLSPEKKNQNSPLSYLDADFYLKQINHLMETDQEYLDPDLNLISLAKRMNTPRNNLSRIINEATGYNFTDFINSYRIEKLLRLMKDHDRADESILTLAFEAGFNSKAPFNKAFKKFIGEVPTVYRKRVLSEVKDKY